MIRRVRELTPNSGRSKLTNLEFSFLAREFEDRHLPDLVCNILEVLGPMAGSFEAPTMVACLAPVLELLASYC